MPEPRGTSRLEHAVRALSGAGKALRLYPAASPIPRQTVLAAEAALAEYFADGEPVFSLTVAREGFLLYGEPFGTTISGARELADSLRDHAVAELCIMPGCSADELLGFLAAVMEPDDVIAAAGGLSKALVARNVDTIRVADVRLTVAEQVMPVSGGDIDEFLRELTRDPDKLTAWFGAAADGDPATFEESLAELVRVSGGNGLEQLMRSLSVAFKAQTPEHRDVLLGLAMEHGPARDVASGMFGHLSSGDIAGSILGGSFGKNMLSLSSALANLPLERITAQVRAEVQAMLPSSGHSAKEADFLNHMLDVRSRTTPEPALVDSNATYRAVADAARLTPEALAAARSGVAASAGGVTAASVRTMLRLLDQQKDFELYCASVDNLAAMVPRLITQGDLKMAARVLAELSNREAYHSGPWPQLAARLTDALATAAGGEAMGGLLRAVMADESNLQVAREIVRHTRGAGLAELVREAMTLKADGIATAEKIAGRRVIDLLNEQALSAQWFHLAPVVARLAAEGDPRSLATIETLASRPAEQARREVASGLAEAGGPAAVRILAKLLRDASAEVQIVTTRAIIKHSTQGGGDILGARLVELDLDNGDFPVGREIIGALSKLPGKAADDALARIGSRRQLIKRGHFAEVQELVKQAQAMRTRLGGAT